MKSFQEELEEILTDFEHTTLRDYGVSEKEWVVDDFSVFKKTITQAAIRALPEEKIGTSTHGNCCTCQDCKMPHDECKCEHNSIVDEAKRNLGGGVTMTTIEKLKAIENAKDRVIYDIHYCRAGVGFKFYWPKKDDGGSADSWRAALNVKKYYKTFEDAVDAEYLCLEDKPSHDQE